MTYTTGDLNAEAQEAKERIWFVQAAKIVERTDSTISLRLYIQQDLFIQVFHGEVTGSLYFALLEGSQRIFGIDRDSGEWHLHPYDAPHQHVPCPEGLGPKPLLAFLARVEKLLIEHELL